ncbi:MAG: hypothetical protein H0T15_09495, partial [Thermoleophilaceae bacterium]|nr:hypothetical protein [Thermoleophilaceae bacterium]
MRSLVLASCLLALLPASAIARSSTFERGFLDDDAFRARPGPERTLAYQGAASAGAGFLRLNVFWSSIAPRGRRKPAGFSATNPADPRYKWA